MRNFLGGDLDATSADDEIKEMASWFFGPFVKEEYSKSWNRALQLIRETIADAKGKTTKVELSIQTSLFWVVNTSMGQSGFSSTFLKFVARRLNEIMEASLLDVLTRLVVGSGKGLWFETLGHMNLTKTEKEYTAKS